MVHEFQDDIRILCVVKQEEFRSIRLKKRRIGELENLLKLLLATSCPKLEMNDSTPSLSFTSDSKSRIPNTAISSYSIYVRHVGGCMRYGFTKPSQPHSGTSCKDEGVRKVQEYNAATRPTSTSLANRHPEVDSAKIEGAEQRHSVL